MASCRQTKTSDTELTVDLDDGMLTRGSASSSLGHFTFMTVDHSKLCIKLGRRPFSMMIEPLRNSYRNDHEVSCSFDLQTFRVDKGTHNLGNTLAFKLHDSFNVCIFMC